MGRHDELQAQMARGWIVKTDEGVMSVMDVICARMGRRVVCDVVVI